MTINPNSTNVSIQDNQALIRKLAELDALAKSSPQLAQNQLWHWIDTLGQQDQQQQLATLFAQGVPENPCMHTQGMPVGPMRNVPGGAFISAYLKVDSPWTGKTFSADGTSGYNRIKKYTKIPVTLLAPFHRLTREGQEYIGFRFDTSIQQGAVEPKVNVIAIEYAKPAYKNPAMILPLQRVRDELVKLIPHTYLGRATFPDKSGKYQLVGYFALKTPVPTESNHVH